MSFDPRAVDPWIWVAIAVNVLVLIGGLAYAVRSVQQARRQKRRNDAVASAVIAYFRNTGVGVAAGSVSLSPNRFTVIIESQPMKRFRLSHIIEATVRDHVKKSCGLEVDKIYWRFPIRQVPVAAGAAVGAAAGAEEKEAKPGEERDDYINEGLVHYRHLPKMEVEEISLEDFEEVSQKLESQQSGPIGQTEQK